MYEIIGKSEQFYEKEKNGDCYKFYDFKKEKILIAIVADGVSRQPCDWYASKLCCDKIIDFFQKNNDKDFIERIKESIIQTNNLLRNVKGKCAKLSSTLSAIFWQYDINRCYLVNIGDSRIFKVSGNKLVQLTKDDSIKKTKTIRTEIGKRVVDASTLVKFMGMPSDNLKINVTSVGFEQNDMLVLATDGFYTAKPSFEKDMIELSKSENLESSFLLKFKKYSWSADDDMTMILIRN